MTFSASPLIPGQQTPGDDAWADVATAVAAAVEAALPQIPAADPLAAGAPISDMPAVTLPAPAGAAITAYLGGGIEGKVLLVVGQDLVEALAGTPFGKLEPAKALRPALDTLAERLGGRLDGEPTDTAVEGCLDVLTGGTAVVVPLTAGDTVSAVVGVSLAVPAQQQAAAAAGAAPGAAAGATGRTSAATAAGAASSWGIDMLRDVEMEVTCELGRTRMTVRQLLALAPGDVVELDRLAGAPADLLVNGTLLARGEVVVVDESFGLRITEIVTRDAT